MCFLSQSKAASPLPPPFGQVLPGELAVEDLHESLPELHVEGGVDDGVDGTVDVAEPREGVVHGLRDVAVTVHVQDVGDEEGQPADDEDTCRDHRGGHQLACRSQSVHKHTLPLEVAT